MDAASAVDLDESRWDELDLLLSRSATAGPESWKQAEDGSSARGRALLGWEADACALASLRLQALGVSVKAATIPATGMLDGESVTGAPCIGGLRIDWYGHEVILVVRVDDAAEVSSRVSITSRPDHHDDDYEKQEG